MLVYEGGVLTHFRLAVARAVVWTAWSAALLALKVLVRPEHPARVYLEGAAKSQRVDQLNALRVATGPRMDPLAKWRAAAVLFPALMLVMPIRRNTINAIEAVFAVVPLF